jgi:hypothetical protein
MLKPLQSHPLAVSNPACQTVCNAYAIYDGIQTNNVVQSLAHEETCIALLRRSVLREQAAAR